MVGQNNFLSPSILKKYIYNIRKRMDKKIIYYISIAIIILYFFKKRNKISRSRKIKRINNIVKNNFNTKSLEKLKPIVFEPKSEFKSNLYVFIDIFCGNSKRFHNNIDYYLENGIRIHYFASPLNDYSKKFLNHIWDSENSSDKLSKAFENSYNKLKENNDSVKNHMNLVKKLKLRGVPFIITENNYLIPGNISKETLLKIINLK